MKKIILILLILVLIGGGAFYYLQEKPKVSGIEMYIPSEPLFYFEFSDVDQNVRKIKASPFWQEVSQIDFEKVISRDEIGKNRWKAIENLTEQIFTDTSGIIYKKFFSEEVALALYATDFNFEKFTKPSATAFTEFLNEFASSVTIITKLKPEAKIAELISRTFKDYGDGYTTEKIEYKEHTIQLVNIPDANMKVGYTRIGDYMIISVGEEAAKRSVDIVVDQKISLAGDQRYQEAKTSMLDNTGIIAYWNMEGFFDELKQNSLALTKLSTHAPEYASDQLDQIFKSVAGFKTITISMVIDKLTTIKYDVFFDKIKLDKDIAMIYTNCDSIDNKTIKFVPKDVIGYQWSNCTDPSYYWDSFKSEWEQKTEGAQKKSLDMFLQEFEAQWGLSLENDIIKAFGDEVGGYLSKIETGGLFPIPELLLFIKINNQSTIEQVFDKLLEIPYIVKQEETYQGEQIAYVASPLGQAIEPSYSFINGYLLLSINRFLLKQSIDALKNDDLALEANDKFQSINYGLTNKNVSVQFIRLEEFVKAMKDIVEWSNDWVSARDQQKMAFKTGSEKRLSDIRLDMDSYESQLEEKKQRLVSLEDELWNLESQQLDTTLKKKEIELLETAINDLENDQITAKEQEEELVKIIEGFDDSAVSGDDRRLIIDEIIYPFLSGLESLGAVGSRTTLNDHLLESTTYFKN